ncbi:cell envelope integrity protein CreD [Penaeicola halotolerans]|uniref:cell envelope integrity protein CreD n=1 Tax=Penaeicola halotolerans TaxID=2793196 RepID=UPI001CF9092F|nr:cell envelope integrity protein CreD [Penaeicola halotolerans]
MQTENTLEKVGDWIRNSVMLKLITISILILLLLIPSSMVMSVISEREYLSGEATTEVSANWANAQAINGPILTVPIRYEYIENEKLIQNTEYFHILPNELDIQGTVTPETLKKGIYEVVVYRSALNIKGDFSIADGYDRTHLKEVLWDQAFLTIGISDLRGIKEEILFQWDDQKIKALPGSKIPDIIKSGVSIPLANAQDLVENDKAFDFQLTLHGSQKLSFTPVGGLTTVSIDSDWSAPAFSGNFLPLDRSVSDAGFSSTWKVLQLNRNYPQSWTGNRYADHLQSAQFGVDLILPLGDYQKSMRSAKYAIMTIALTFLIFFLVEILNKRKIHPFQYTLVGLALCLFYVLLISISEHTNFNIAYLISSVSVIGMIGLYSMSVFHHRKLSLLLTGILSGLYGFVFVTLQLSNYALLLGSVGLLLILGLTMYFTRNVNWYQLQIKTE